MIGEIASVTRENIVKIKNTTPWETEDLRRLFGRCIQDVRRVEGRGKSQGIEVTIIIMTGPDAQHMTPV